MFRSVYIGLLFSVGVLVFLLNTQDVIASTAVNSTETIELNSATVEQLMALPGIGHKRALDIIQERERRQYRKPSDLLRVRGIGRQIYRRVRRFVRAVYQKPKKE